MQPEILASAPRCGARTRSGAPCCSPAISGKCRCRMHGGKGSGARRGNRNAWKHGARSGQLREIARYLRATSLVVAAANAMVRNQHALNAIRPKPAAAHPPVPVLADRMGIESGTQPHAPRIAGWKAGPDALFR